MLQRHESKASVTLELPWPPSVNGYYRHVGHRTLISKRGRMYRSDVVMQCLLQGIRSPLEGKLKIDVALYPPNRRRFDLDNLLKALFDSMQHGGVFVDDSQIRNINIFDTELYQNMVLVNLEPLEASPVPE